MSSLEQWPREAPALLRFVKLPIRKSQRGLEGILDLAAVPVVGRFLHIVEPVPFCKGSNLVFGEIELEARIAEALEAAVPDLQGSGLVEFGVVEADVDARSKCFVKFSDAVGG